MADVSHRGSYGNNPPQTNVIAQGPRGPAGAGYGILLTEFGAVGDGVTDDTAAIQAAVDYAANNHAGPHPTILVPVGRFLISASIQMHSHVRFVGTGEGISHSAAALSLGYMSEIIAAAGFDDYAFVYDQNSIGVDSMTIPDAEISRISYRGAWAGRQDTTVLTGGMIKFDGVHPQQGCRFEHLICQTVAEDVIYANVLPLPGLFNNVWGRKIGGSVLNIYCGAKTGELSPRTGHYFRATSIQGDLCVGPVIKVDGTPLVNDGRSLWQTVFVFDGIKHEVDSDAAGTVDPTNAYSPHCVHMINCDRAVVTIIGANVLTSNPAGGGTPNTSGGAVLYITGTANKGNYYHVIGSRYGSSTVVTDDYLVHDETRGNGTALTVSKRHTSASWMPTLHTQIGHTDTAVVNEVRVSSDNNGVHSTYARQQTLANGNLEWSDGTVVPDVNLRRITVNRLGTDDIFMARKLMARGQSAMSAGAFAISAGWGSTATIDVDTTSTDQAGTFTVTCGGAGIAANPTVTFTFQDTAVSNDPSGNPVGWGRVPIPMVQLGRDSTGDRTLNVSCDPNFGSLIMQLEGTPVAGMTYVFFYSLMG